MIIGKSVHTTLELYPHTPPVYLRAARESAKHLGPTPKHPSHVSSSSSLQPVSPLLRIRGYFHPCPLALFRVPTFVP